MNQTNENKKKETKKDRLNKKIVKLQKEYIDLYYTDSNVRPQLTEPNINVLLENKGVRIQFNEIAKTVTKYVLNSNDNFTKKVCSSDKTLTSFLEDEIVRGDFQSKSYEALYRKLDSIAYKNAYNPVKNYLLQNYKNNKDKINNNYNNLNDFISLLKVRHNEQGITNMLTKKWLISCVACQLDDDFVSHGALTLKGDQGIGKTTWFRLLIPEYLKQENQKKDGYFKEGFKLDLKNKDKVIEFLQYWIVELGELDSTAKKQLDEVKAFITKKYDTFRSPFGRTNEDYKRRTVACASIDKDQFLRDDVNRRWWVIDCLDIDYTKSINVDMLWAELVDLYYKKETCYLNKDELKLLNEHNSQFNLKTDTDSLIESCFDWNNEKRYYLESKDIFLYLSNMNKMITTSKIGISLKKMKIGFKEGRSRKKFYKMPKILRCVVADDMYQNWNFEDVEEGETKNNQLDKLFSKYKKLLDIDKQELHCKILEDLGKNKENELIFTESDYIKLFYESKIMYLSTLMIDCKEKDIISLCIMQLEELQEKLDRKFIIDFNKLSKESKYNDFKIFKKMLIKKDTGLAQSKVSD